MKSTPATGSPSSRAERSAAGSTVTYLTTAINRNDKMWDHVETTVNGQTVRSYIPSGRLNAPTDPLPDLDFYYGDK